MMPAVELRTKLNDHPSNTLVVCCSDNRFLAGIQEFVNQVLRIENYDLLAIPGGPQCLTLVEYLPKFSWAGWRWTRFLLESRGLKRLILIAHEDCLWYQELPLHLHDSPEPRKRQEQDLRRAQIAITKELPQVSIGTYFATHNSTGTISMEAIPV